MISAPSSAGISSPNTSLKLDRSRSTNVRWSLVSCRSMDVARGKACELRACAALSIEDDAPPTCRTEQPLAPARVSKTEGTATDLPLREDGSVARTRGALVRG